MLVLMVSLVLRLRLFLLLRIRLRLLLLQRLELFVLPCRQLCSLHDFSIPMIVSVVSPASLCPLH